MNVYSSFAIPTSRNHVTIYIYIHIYVYVYMYMCVCVCVCGVYVCVCTYSPYLEPDSDSVCQEMTPFLWSPKVHYYEVCSHNPITGLLS
jgi:hypothetical protein